MSNLSQFAAGGDPQYLVSGTTYALGKTVRSPIDHQRYVRVVAGAGTTDPYSDPGNWKPDGARPIKATQRGVATFPTGANVLDVTIASTVLAVTQLRLLGATGLDNANNTPIIYLTSPTNLRIQFGSFITGPNNLISWELTEYY